MPQAGDSSMSRSMTGAFVRPFAAVAVCAVALATPALADFVVLPVEVDTAPYSFLPSLARGTNTTLYAFQTFDENSTVHAFETYLWFDVTQSDLPAGHVLVEATLVVTYAFDFTGFGNTSNLPGTLECREVTQPWNGATLNWTNRPTVTTPFHTISGITGFGALLCDATPIVLDWIGNRTRNDGFALTSPTPRVMGMHAKEAPVDVSLKPLLILRSELPEPGLPATIAPGIAALVLARFRRHSRPRNRSLPGQHVEP